MTVGGLGETASGWLRKISDLVTEGIGEVLDEESYQGDLNIEGLFANETEDNPYAPLLSGVGEEETPTDNQVLIEGYSRYGETDTDNDVLET